MLKKLLKYEFKATARYFLPLIAALLVVAVLNRICLSFNQGSIEALKFVPTFVAAFLYIAIIIAIFVLALIITIKRFYNSLLTDEGYLMMTLPASVDSHIWSKTITAGVWVIASTLATICSAAVIGAADGTSVLHFFTELGEVYQESFANWGMHVWMLGIIWLLAMIFCLLSSLLSIYMCISLGHQVSNHQILGGVGAYILYSLVLQVLGTIATTIAIKCGFFSWVSTLDAVTGVYLVSVGVLVLGVILSVVPYLITRYLLKYRLNLE